MACCEFCLFQADITTNVTLGVVEDVTIATFVQSYKSPTALHNVTFRFPLNDGAVVTEFAVTIGGIDRKGEIKPKKQASAGRRGSSRKKSLDADEEEEGSRKKVMHTIDKPKVTDIICANKNGLWTFADVVRFLPPEAKVWSPAEKGSDLYVTVVILKILASDYANEFIIWNGVSERARKKIKDMFSLEFIRDVETALQFSL